MWFDDADSMRTALKSPETAATAADSSNFAVAEIVTFTGAVEDLLA